MLKRLKAYWSDLRRGKPGSRFQDQYDRNQQDQKGPIGRVFRIIAGMALIPVGLFFLAVPGPGLLIVVIGAVLVARELGFAARLLDTLELRARSAWRWAQRRRRQLVKARRAVTR
jgi:hypothetical protein